MTAKIQIISTPCSNYPEYTIYTISYISSGGFTEFTETISALTLIEARAIFNPFVVAYVQALPTVVENGGA